MKKRQPKAYSLEFGEEALRQLQAGTKPIRHLAEELGIYIETLRNWRRDARPSDTKQRYTLARRRCRAGRRSSAMRSAR